MDPYGQKPHPWPSEGAPHLAEAPQGFWLPEAIIILTCTHDPALPEAWVRAQSLSRVTGQPAIYLGSELDWTRFGAQTGVKGRAQSPARVRIKMGTRAGDTYILWAQRANQFLSFLGQLSPKGISPLSRNYGPAGTPAKWGRGRAGQGADRAVGCRKSTGLQRGNVRTM